LTTLTVRVGPFSTFFTNVNAAMKLRGHSHFATVDLFFRAEAGPDTLGFPSFASTHAAIQGRLMEFFERPLRDHTNERIARELFQVMENFKHEAIEQWEIPCSLVRLDLSVRGVPDAIGHADSFTTYTVER
jgi:hypothetical protein